ncbi:S-formylglutathione hydrolase [Silvanigrella aquatica]|nr:S-formylglutathione hydrolase [Silvanigrella aquatica]
MEKIESIKECGGNLNRYVHNSIFCKTKMTFSVYLPPKAQVEKVPALYWLSGLTCTDDNARIKAGAQRYASELGIALIFPDTSPRGDYVPDFKERYDLGQGAGFYVNATQSPWAENYQMYSYITEELPKLIEDNLPILINKKSISGHSMGGHGALICALKNPKMFASVSAFAPICNPTNSPWGKSCFKTYLGEDESKWLQYDATWLIKNGCKVHNILIDQGLSDEFYEKEQLLPENFREACHEKNQSLNLRFQEGYDHSYHFISSFIGEHLSYHAKYLKK